MKEKFKFWTSIFFPLLHFCVCFLKWKLGAQAEPSTGCEIPPLHAPGKPQGILEWFGLERTPKTIPSCIPHHIPSRRSGAAPSRWSSCCSSAAEPQSQTLPSSCSSSDPLMLPLLRGGNLPRNRTQAPAALSISFPGFRSLCFPSRPSSARVFPTLPGFSSHSAAAFLANSFHPVWPKGQRGAQRSNT